MNRSVRSLLDSCRVPESVPVGPFGLWVIDRHHFTNDNFMQAYRKAFQVGYDSFTALMRWHGGNLHTAPECVMEDTTKELRRHLPILLRASGCVLVSGLGLGCVVRGLLSKPEVTHVDVIEIDPFIIARIGPEFRDNPRVTIHQGDALTIEWPNGICWDWAWHDVWCEQGSLDVLHAELLGRYSDMVANSQGAWQFPREIKRRWPHRMLNSPRRLSRSARSR